MKEILSKQLNEIFIAEAQHFHDSQNEKRKILKIFDELENYGKEIISLLNSDNISVESQNGFKYYANNFNKLLNTLHTKANDQNGLKEINGATILSTHFNEETSVALINKQYLSEQITTKFNIVKNCKTRFNEFAKKLDIYLIANAYVCKIGELINEQEVNNLSELNSNIKSLLPLIQNNLKNIDTKDDPSITIPELKNNSINTSNEPAIESKATIEEINKNTKLLKDDTDQIFKMVYEIHTNSNPKPDFGHTEIITTLNAMKLQIDQNDHSPTEKIPMAILKIIRNITPYFTLAFCFIILSILLWPLFRTNSTDKKEASNTETAITDSTKKENEKTLKDFFLSELSRELAKLPKIPNEKSIVNGKDLSSANETINQIKGIAETIKPLAELLKKDSPEINLLESIKGMPKDRITAIQAYISKELPTKQKESTNDNSNLITLQSNYIKDLNNYIKGLQDKVITPLQISAEKHAQEYDKIKNLINNKKQGVSETIQHPVAIIIPIDKTFGPNKSIFNILADQLKNDLAKNKITNARIFWESNAQIEEYTDETKANMMQRNWDGGVSEPEMTTAKNVLEKMEFKKCEIIYILGPNSTVVPKIETAMYLNGNKCSIINIRTSDKLNTRFLNSWLEVAKINGGAFRMVDAQNNSATDIIKEITNIAQNK